MSSYKDKKPFNLSISIPKDFIDVILDLKYNYFTTIKNSPTKWVGYCRKNNNKNDFIKIYNGIKLIKGDVLINDIKKSFDSSLLNFISCTDIEAIDNYNILKFPCLKKDYKTIHKHLKDGSLNEYDVLQIILQMIDNFNELWSYNIVHNDIQTTNLMYSKSDFKLKVIDFETSNKKDMNNFGKELSAFLSCVIYILSKYLKLNPKYSRYATYIINNFDKFDRKKMVKLYTYYYNDIFEIIKNKTLLNTLFYESDFFYSKINSLLDI